MKLEKIVGFKSKLSSDYSNVFDGYSTPIEYFNFLRRIYENAILYEGNFKSFNEIDNLVTIDVPADYATIREYNYFAFFGDITIII